ncbi:MAG: (d)CMP kinase [Lawsonibacter sp.]|nr:(d)CMP kinase [Lawsonibacter sp.]
MSFKSIAIDGPAGAGKSTLARKLADKLGFLYVDTGAIYRTVAVKVLWEKADPADPAQVIPLLEGLEIHIGYDSDGVQRMYLEGEDVSTAIRKHKVSGVASQVSAIPEVRAFLLDFQRKLARESNVVMDGRDIGTVVLPQADVKIFLTAAPEARAKRRLLELEQRGEAADFDAILRDIKDRDWQDEHRAIAPLKQAADAVLLDTTRLDLGQSMNQLLFLVKEKIK